MVPVKTGENLSSQRVTKHPCRGVSNVWGIAVSSGHSCLDLHKFAVAGSALTEEPPSKQAML